MCALARRRGGSNLEHGPNDLLLTTVGTDSVGVWSLVDPAAPAVVGSSLYLGSNRARAVAITRRWTGS